MMIVWFLNLYNFMDGIDGIAAIEAVTVCVGGASVALILGHKSGALLYLLLAAASAGFLVWNFPPAKIFMGDAGSGFLGVVFGVLTCSPPHKVADACFGAWLILLGAFIVDATVTLLRRLDRGERVYQAHRSHAYQHAARALTPIEPVTLAIGTINLLWLLPLRHGRGRLAARRSCALTIACLPLVALALRWRAGLPRSRARLAIPIREIDHQARHFEDLVHRNGAGPPRRTASTNAAAQAAWPLSCRHSRMPVNPFHPKPRKRT